MQQHDDFIHLPSKEGVLVRHDPLGSGTFGEVYDITEITEVGHYGRAGKYLSVPQFSPEAESEHIRQQRMGKRPAHLTFLQFLELQRQRQRLNILEEFRILRLLAPGSNYRIVRAFGLYDFANETLVMTMDKRTGDSLDKRIASGGLAPEDSMRIFSQVMDGLDHIHRLGFVHRDIKPANIVCSLNGNATIVDFGIAGRLTGEGIGGKPPRGQQFGGSLSFMAPEVFDLYSPYRQGPFATATAAIDVWSAGALLYEMLTNKLLFALPDDCPSFQCKYRGGRLVLPHVQQPNVDELREAVRIQIKLAQQLQHGPPITARLATFTVDAERHEHLADAINFFREPEGLEQQMAALQVGGRPVIHGGHGAAPPHAAPGPSHAGQLRGDARPAAGFNLGSSHHQAAPVDINKTFIVHSDRQQPAGHSAAQIGAGGQQRDQQPCDCDQRRERAIRAGLTGAMFDHPIWKMGAGDDREPPTGLRLSNLMALLMNTDPAQRPKAGQIRNVAWLGNKRSAEFSLPSDGYRVAEEGETAGSTQAKKRTLPVHFIINRFYDQNVSRLFPLVGHVARKYPGVLCKGDVRIFLNMHYRPDKYDVKIWEGESAQRILAAVKNENVYNELTPLEESYDSPIVSQNLYVEVRYR